MFCTVDWWRCERCACAEEGWDRYRYGIRNCCGQVGVRDGSCWRQLLDHRGCRGGGTRYLQQHETVHPLPHLIQHRRGKFIQVYTSPFTPNVCIYDTFGFLSFQWHYSHRTGADIKHQITTNIRCEMVLSYLQGLQIGRANDTDPLYLPWDYMVDDYTCRWFVSSWRLRLVCRKL